mmetsp:Transcript_21891/g.47780  ORF Transcript_21891/g.47780 Transcript_21891/m.47780 type:complete len:219 (+) Transcript_21891:991-1647(+)
MVQNLGGPATQMRHGAVQLVQGRALDARRMLSVTEFRHGGAAGAELDRMVEPASSMVHLPACHTQSVALAQWRRHPSVVDSGRGRNSAGEVGQVEPSRPNGAGPNRRGRRSNQPGSNGQGGASSHRHLTMSMRTGSLRGSCTSVRGHQKSGHTDATLEWGLRRASWRRPLDIRSRFEGVRTLDVVGNHETHLNACSHSSCKLQTNPADGVRSLATCLN